MARKNKIYDSTVAERIKVGKPRTSKRHRKKGNACSSTSRKGNGAKVR